MFILLIAAISLGLLTGPLGCFILWKRMAYFCESITHSALLGVAIGIIFGLGFNLGVVISCLLFAAILVWLQAKQTLTTDSILGMLAHASLAIGIVILHMLGQAELDMHDILLGHFTDIDWSDVLLLTTIAAVSLAFIGIFWRQLLLITISLDLARVEKLPIALLNVGFMLIAALAVAVSVQIAGMLLLTALIIIPAAAARLIAISPLHMAIYASLMSMTSSFIGILLSSISSIPTGAAIVVVATTLFICSYLANTIYSISK